MEGIDEAMDSTCFFTFVISSAMRLVMFSTSLIQPRLAKDFSLNSDNFVSVASCAMLVRMELASLGERGVVEHLNAVSAPVFSSRKLGILFKSTSQSTAWLAVVKLGVS